MSFSDHNPNSDRPLLKLAEAKRKIMDLVAQRDHSESELRAKLSSRCEPEVLEPAIAWAKEQNWLAKPEALKEKIAERLSLKGKGVRQINQKLEALGLDSIQTDPETEFEKAKKLALTKFSAEDFHGLDFQQAQKLKAKIVRFLAARGFEADVVSKILKEEFKAGALSHDEEY